MSGIIGRLQSEVDSEGKRTDIHINTDVHAIKTDDDKDMATVVEGIGISVTMSKDKPTFSSLWIIPE